MADPLPSPSRAHSPAAGPRGFAFAHVAGGAAGLSLAAAWFATFGPPDPVLAVALGWLAVPLPIGLWALTSRDAARPQAAAMLSFCGFVTWLAAHSGGVASPFLFWFVIAPMEAALTGRRGFVLGAAGLAGLGVATLVLLELFSALPPRALPPEVIKGLHVAAPLLAILYAGLVAVAAEMAHRHANARAAREEWKYRTLAEGAADMISRHAADGRILFVSPAAETLLGLPPETLIGRAPVALVHPEDEAMLQRAFAAASYHRASAGAELRMRKADGSHVWVELRCRPAGPASPAHEIIAVTRDVSERKRGEAEMRRARDAAESANQAKSRFLANMSHELRTPLNAIIGFSDIARAEMFGPLGHAKYREYAHLVHDAGQHLLELIGDILDMSKIEAGKYDLQREALDLREVIAQSLATVKVAADKSGVRLSLDAAEPLGPVMADKRAVRQILLNLLSNAVKFTPSGGRVMVAARREGAAVVLAVADTGVGIPPEALARIGTPFEQAETEFTRAQAGTGLGLAIVKALAALHGGSVTIESALGDGTTVTVRLPVAGEAQATPPTGEGEARIYRRAGKAA